MNKETNKEVDSLLSAFDNKNIEEEVDAVNIIDPSIRARTELFDFFSNRLLGLSKREVLKNKIQDSLEKFLDSEDITLPQLLSLYKIVFSESSLASESVISLLKPSGSSPNPLLTAMDTRKTVEDNFETMHGDMDTKSIKAIDMLYRALKKYEVPENEEDQ